MSITAVIIKKDAERTLTPRGKASSYSSDNNDEQGNNLSCSNREENVYKTVSEVDTGSEGGSDYEIILSDFTKTTSSLC